MDRPVHLEATHPEQAAIFAYAARNSLRRIPATVIVGEAPDIETVLALKAADASIQMRSAKGD